MAVATGTAMLAGSAIAGATSLLGGLFGSKASNKAAQQQTQAIDAAQRRVDGAVATVNPQIQATADSVVAANNAAIERGQGLVTDAAQRGMARTDAATQQANGLLDPYVGAGTDATHQLSDLAGEKFTFSQDDPSYQWRLQEGQKALERSAAARGSATGGAAAKSLLRYGQGMASTEYGAAFDRFQRDRSGRSSILSDLAGRGYSASSQQGANITSGARFNTALDSDASRYNADLGVNGAQWNGNVQTRSTETQANNTITGARTTADLLTQKGNAQASGTVGSANAWTGALGGAGGVANNVWQGLLLRDLLNGGANGPKVNIGDMDKTPAQAPGLPWIGF